MTDRQFRKAYARAEVTAWVCLALLAGAVVMAAQVVTGAMQ